MTSQNELKQHFEATFRKRFRVIGENSNGRFSSPWIFWGNRGDFYFGAKALTGNMKISLHANGVGYLAFDRRYIETKRSAGFALQKTLLEWKLPMPKEQGAVHVASILLPSDFYTHERPSIADLRKTFILGVEDHSAAEIGIFFSREFADTLEEKLLQIGSPLVIVSLESGLNVSIVVRSVLFDPSVLPTTEQFESASRTELETFDTSPNRTNLNAVMWDKPRDGAALQLVDIGGIRIERRIANS